MKNGDKPEGELQSAPLVQPSARAADSRSRCHLYEAQSIPRVSSDHLYTEKSLFVLPMPFADTPPFRTAAHYPDHQ